MRILIWHGYLLHGTGSNVYTRELARALGALGHEVTVLCQDPDSANVDLGGARVVRPELTGPLPVFVLDRYQDADPQLLNEMSEGDLRRFVRINADAVRAAGPADLLLLNHVLLGGPVGEASGLPFIVKAHGSELEFAMRGNPGMCRWAKESLLPAKAVIAGSAHVAEVLRDLVGTAPGQVHVIAPGVDLERMRPQPRAVALAALLAECREDPASPMGPRNERLPDTNNAARLARFLAGDRPTVVYVGKLSQEKGVHLLLEALRGLGTRAVVVGFGPERARLESLADPDVLFTGPLEHRHLRHLWPLADVSVTPSMFPEAFGMVAAEAAACGCPPLVARHSGLAEIAAALESAYPPHLSALTSFDSGSASDLRARLSAVLALPPGQRRVLSASARRAAELNWGWETVARRILALA
ncbi:MAG: glycosyltransferase family 4 protein [Candidatus Nanopelagicales bacterium]|nr:glycosyltransferase family 4 protein [Candidatus Nanopelagicales bacterium]MDZ4249896.1 glycosyltransferase family 4 protein [Candidatus Nanopelagicales bacterium]